MSKDGYKALSKEERAEAVRKRYSINGRWEYSTSRDFHLRELEIDFILKNVYPGRILDVGCGNGYTGLRIAEAMKATVTGMDFSQSMIDGGKHLKRKYIGRLRGSMNFVMGDIRKLPFNSKSFDIVISERGLLNLPSRECQYNTILEIVRVLDRNSLYIMIEGARGGLRNLNRLRNKVGLDSIEDISKDHPWSLKFEEEEIDAFLKQHFFVAKEQYFGTYMLISKIVHPILVYPNKPKFDAKINEIAKKISMEIPSFGNIGQIRALVLGKRSI